MKIKKRKLISWISLVFLLASFFAVLGCEKGKATEDKGEKKIVLAASTWDSAKVNAEIISYLIKNGFGYQTEMVTASSMIELTEHAKGEIDIRPENWTKTYGNEYFDAVKKGDIIEVNEILKENTQGLYIPRYMVEGDTARGIKPITPDLRKLSDIFKYKDIFEDSEDPKKGRIYGAPNDWSTNAILEPKLKNYGLDKAFNLFMPGSGPALDAAIASAYEKGVPIIAYYWEPTWLLGMYDMVLLEEPPFEQAKWDAKTYDCAFPADKVTITVHKDLPNSAPEVIELLKKYSMNSSDMNAILANMQKNNLEADAAALLFLKDNISIWSKWVPQNIADKVIAEIK